MAHMTRRTRVNNKRAVAAAIAALLPFTGAAFAQDATPSGTTQAGDSNAELRKDIEDQKQRLAILERKLENQQEAATAAAAAAPKLTISASRFQVGTTDGANFIRFRGTLFADSRVYGGDSAPETA